MLFLLIMVVNNLLQLVSKGFECFLWYSVALYGWTLLWKNEECINNADILNRWFCQKIGRTFFARFDTCNENHIATKD